MRYLQNLLQMLRRRSSGAPTDAVSASASYARGNALQAQGDFDEAVVCYRQALDLTPDHADAQFNLATTLITLGRDAEAEQLLRAMIEAAPASADALQNLGVALAAQQRHAEAEHYLRQALKAGVPSVPLLKSLALALHHQSRYPEAIATLERALTLDADAQLHFDLAEMLYQHGEFGRAAIHLDRTLKLAPAHWEAAARLGCIDLLDGKIRAGWAGYRLLMRDALVAHNPGIALDTALPADLSGKTVLLLGEQGIGDELIFLRFVPPLKQRGATVFYRAESRIGALLKARQICVDGVYALGEKPLPARDFTLLIGDLPGALGSDDIPCAIALVPLATRVAAWRERLRACGPAPYIGVGWRAGINDDPAAHLPRALAKNIPLPQLAPALRQAPGTLVALQRYPEPDEINEFARLLGRPLPDFSAVNDDLEDVLALLALLDDYVAVSNTNMHLLAGLRRRARVLMPCPPDWRWMASGKHSPWFPGFTIYRQEGDGDWTAALAQLQRDLSDRGSRKPVAPGLDV